MKLVRWGKAGAERAGLVDGASVSFDFDMASISLTAHNKHIQLEPLPSFLKDLIIDGGLVPHLEKRFASYETDIETKRASAGAWYL